MPFHTEPEDLARWSNQKICMDHLRVDRFDLHLRVRLAMAKLALFALLRLVGENRDLLRLAVLNHLAGDRCALHIGVAQLEAVFAAQGYHLEGDCAVFFRGQLLDINDVALLYFVLLAAGFDNRVHGNSCLFFELAIRRRADRHF